MCGKLTNDCETPDETQFSDGDDESLIVHRSANLTETFLNVVYNKAILIASENSVVLAIRVRLVRGVRRLPLDEQ